jgi:hypothetical protein
MNMGRKQKPILSKLKNLFSSKEPLAGINGVYLGENRFLRVINQPEGKPEYVSSMSGIATNFQLASNYGNIGLIAHNYLGGRYFEQMKIGQIIYVMNGNRQHQEYRVTRIYRFQALNPRSTRSDFIDLDTQQRRTVSDVFKQIYTGNHHLVLQTCIEKGIIFKSQIYNLLITIITN